MRNKQALALFIALALASLACVVSSAQFGTNGGNVPPIAPRNDFETPSTEKNSNSMSSTSATVIAVQSLNIRTGPGTQYPTIGYLMHGEFLTVYDCSGVWSRISADGLTPERWVNGLYLSGR